MIHPNVCATTYILNLLHRHKQITDISLIVFTIWIDIGLYNNHWHKK